MLGQKERTLSSLEEVKFELVQGGQEGGTWKCSMAKIVSLDTEKAYSQQGKNMDVGIPMGPSQAVRIPVWLGQRVS